MKEFNYHEFKKDLIIKWSVRVKYWLNGEPHEIFELKDELEILEWFLNDKDSLKQTIKHYKKMIDYENTYITTSPICKWIIYMISKESEIRSI